MVPKNFEFLSILDTKSVMAKKYSLQDTFKTAYDLLESFRTPFRYLQDTFQTSFRHVPDTFLTI